MAPLTYAQLFSFFIAYINVHGFLYCYNTVSATSDPSEVSALLTVKEAIGDTLNELGDTWVNDDPCESQWRGVFCTIDLIDGYRRVEEIRLFRMNFTGTLSPALGNLTRLRILNFMWNSLTGPIPREIGKLSHLQLLLLNGNMLSGTLPEELGSLLKLNRFQIDSNNISGPIPSSFQHLIRIRHIHFNNNSLNGSIPKELGKLPALLHLLLDTNDFSGELPPELSNISRLVILQLDNNHFSGSIPSNYSTMNLTKLSLRNCNLTGSIPDLSSLVQLSYLDLSHNHLSGPLPSLKRGSQSITTIDLSFNQLDGELPVDYLQFSNLERLLLQNNLLDGSVQQNLQIHRAYTSDNSTLILDFRNNNFSQFSKGVIANVTIRLSGNPVCNDDSTVRVYCMDTATSDFNTTLVMPAPLSISGCRSDSCDKLRGQELNPKLWEQDQCLCAYPLSMEYRLKSPSFSVFVPHEEGFNIWISSGLHLEPHQVVVSKHMWESGPRLWMNIKLFPNVSRFAQSKVEDIYSILSNWSMPSNDTFGPYELLGVEIGFPYNGSSSRESNAKGISSGLVVGIVIGATVFVAVIVAIATLLVVRHWNAKAIFGQRRLVKKHHECIKISGVKCFTFGDMSMATNNFDPLTQIGKGGYGKVYKGRLSDGMIVAIKRAQEGSLQGSNEFYTEIELLSRVHHRNLVSLIGYCDDDGEQMLVYEYMPNGTLQDHLSSQSKVPLDFQSRLQIAVGSAKGILYLHTEADPPIYHRDIKTSNILLDEKMKAKVADFGLSKLAPQPNLDGCPSDHITTVVKGTPGYLDPEYFLTHQLTDKSDVYSFGVVLLELITGMQPIYEGKNLVREVNMANDREKVLLMVDHRMGTYPPKCMLSLIDLAISCCNNFTTSRPSMAEVARILVEIWQSMQAHYVMHPLEFSASEKEPFVELQNLLNNASVSSSTNDSTRFSGVVVSLNPR